ncbi:MAG: hypothetical protein ACK53Y_01465, partial [bacterium]
PRHLLPAQRHKGDEGTPAPDGRRRHPLDGRTLPGRGLLQHHLGGHRRQHKVKVLPQGKEDPRLPQRILGLLQEGVQGNKGTQGECRNLPPVLRHPRHHRPRTHPPRP